MNRKGFGLTEMIIIMFTLILCLVIVVIIYNKNFKNLSNNESTDKELRMNSIETVDKLNDYEKDEIIDEDKTKYNELEEKIENAAKLYIDNNYALKNNKIIITVNELIKDEYISELKNPKDKKKTCKGYIIYNGNNKYASYIKCSDDYETDNYNSDFE